jgi:tetratricopeptide (TPR) repeat protein
MKKTLWLTVGLLLFTMATGCAQKSQVTKAYNRLFTEPIDYVAAIADIEVAQQDPTTATQSRTWYVAGRIGYTMANTEVLKMRMQQAANDENLYRGLKQMFENYIIADKYDGVIDKKGKVKYSQRRNIKADFKEMHPFYINAGAAMFEFKEFGKAYTLFSQYLKIADLDMWEAKDGIKIDSTYNMIQFYAGIVASNMDSTQLAIKHFKSLVQTSYPEKEAVYEMLYSLYQNQNDTVSFISVLKEGVDLYPESPFFIGNLINYYATAGKFTEAIDYLDEALERSPKNIEYLNVKGTLLIQMGEFDKAKAIFTESLALNSEHPNALFGMGRAWAFEGDVITEKAQDIKDNKLYRKEQERAKEYFANAIKYLESTKELMSKNDSQYNDLLQNMRVLYLRLGQTDKYNKIDAEIKAF